MATNTSSIQPGKHLALPACHIFRKKAVAFFCDSRVKFDFVYGR